MVPCLWPTQYSGPWWLGMTSVCSMEHLHPRDLSSTTYQTTQCCAHTHLFTIPMLWQVQVNSCTVTNQNSTQANQFNIYLQTICISHLLPSLAASISLDRKPFRMISTSILQNRCSSSAQHITQPDCMACLTLRLLEHFSFSPAVPPTSVEAVAKQRHA